MSSSNIRDDIQTQQNAVAALNDQIQQAQDRGQNDQVPGLMQTAKEHTDQIQRLEDKLQQENEKEKQEIEQKAREAQKEEDDKKNGGVFSL